MAAGAVSTAAGAPITVRFTREGRPRLPDRPRRALLAQHRHPAALRPRLLHQGRRRASSRRSPSTPRRPAPRPRPASRPTTTRSARRRATARSSRTASAPATTPTRSRPPRRPTARWPSPTTRPGWARPTWSGSRPPARPTWSSPLNANTFSAANQSHSTSSRAAPARRSSASWSRRPAATPATPASRRRPPRRRPSTAAAAWTRGCATSATTPGRTTNPLADSASFVHRIHAGETVATANLFHGIAATYPQDLRSCDACHGGAAQGAQALTHPTTLSCKGCHDYVSFTGAAPAFCGINGAAGARHRRQAAPLQPRRRRRPPTPTCATCHGPTAGFATARYHEPVVPPDPTNAWLAGRAATPTPTPPVVAAGGRGAGRARASSPTT